MRASKLAKFIDRYIGPCLLFLIGLLRFKRSLPTHIQSIGVLKENAIGDAVLLTEVLKEIQAVYPQAKVTVYLTESNGICAPLFSEKYSVKIIPLKKPLLAIKTIRQARHDVFIDYGAWPRINALITALSGAQFIIGFNTPGQFRHYAYDLFAAHSNGCHELQNYRILTVLIGVPRTHNPPCLELELKKPDNFTASHYVVIHPWGGGDNGQLREWSIENWQDIIDHLNGKNMRVFISGAPAEAEKNQQFKNCESIAGKFDFHSFMAILKNANVVLSVNTGIMHLSAALGAPTIGLSGPTNTQRWGALGEKAINLHPHELSCGFLNLGFEYEGQRKDCMNLITPDSVISEINKII